MFWNSLLLLFFIFVPKVLAEDVSVSFASGATTGTLNNQFDVRVKISATKAGTYYVKADDSTCTIDMLYEPTNNWSNGCYLATNVMKQMIINNDGESAEETLRLRAIGSTGTYTLHAYVYDIGRTLLSTSLAYSITINPQPTATLTPTPTSTPTPTLTPTPTKILTPTPTEAPIIEPTQIPEITKTPIIPTTEPVKELTINTSEKKESKNYLPIIFVGLGLITFIVPILIPKIKAKIESKKNEIPPIEPPIMTN